jgi:hypothetical protein
LRQRQRERERGRKRERKNGEIQGVFVSLFFNELIPFLLSFYLSSSFFAENGFDGSSQDGVPSTDESGESKCQGLFFPSLEAVNLSYVKYVHPLFSLLKKTHLCARLPILYFAS